MTYGDLQTWRIRHHLRDEWWVATRHYTFVKPVTLGEAWEYKCGSPQMKIFVMHLQLSVSNPVWTELTLDSLLAGRMRLPGSPQTERQGLVRA